MERQRCFNRFCNKILTEEDKTTFGGMFSSPKFLKYHLCNDCWAKFDGQKMRGRFRQMGISHEKAVEITAALDRLSAEHSFPGPVYHLGHPSDEKRYTENLEEWIEWQSYTSIR
jgi:hypothetical protein